MNLRNFTILVTLVIVTMATHSCTTEKSERISISGNKFIKNGEEFFFVGANTPWDSWNDFGGDYNEEFWEQECERLHKSGLNSTRIWISCDNLGQPYIDSLGNTHAATQAFWNNMDHLMQHAQKWNIYIMATITSFDHFDSLKSNFESWRTMIQSEEKINRYIDTFLIPLVTRYESNPYFFSIDVCNEPEWIHENKQYGALAWEPLQMFAGKCAAAIHAGQSPVLVSIGSTATKWASTKYEGNVWSDELLKKIAKDELAYMDYWHIHYYQWINESFSNPFKTSAEEYNLHDKPCVIGETPGLNSIYGFPITYKEIYELPYKLGYAGVFPWTSNSAGIGNFGSLDTFGEGALQFAKSYPKLVK